MSDDNEINAGASLPMKGSDVLEIKNIATVPDYQGQRLYKILN